MACCGVCRALTSENLRSYKGKRKQWLLFRRCDADLALLPLCPTREVGEAGFGGVGLDFAGRKHMVLEDELNFAVVFSAGNCRHLQLSFSPQLQTTWILAFRGLSLCFKPKHRVRLGLARFCRPGVYCWAGQPGGSQTWAAAAFVVPAPTSLFLCVTSRGSTGPGRGQGLSAPRGAQQAARAPESLPHSVSSVHSQVQLPQNWIAYSLVWISVSLQFPRLEASWWRKPNFVFFLASP